MSIKIGNKKYQYEGKTYYIGRPSPLGNPFPVKASKFEKKIYTIEESLRLYRLWLWERIISNDREVFNELRKIRQLGDVTLLCYCVDENGEGQCHGFIVRDCLHWMNTVADVFSE